MDGWTTFVYRWLQITIYSVWHLTPGLIGRILFTFIISVLHVPCYTSIFCITNYFYFLSSHSLFFVISS